MIKKLSQTALAVTCLIGTIQMDNQPVGYFDEGQSIISSSVSGWSFGLNSAMACDDFNSCEHVEVIGEPWEDDPVWDDLGYDDGSGGGSGGGGSGGGDGGGSSSSDTSAAEQKRQCENEVDTLVSNCSNAYADLAWGASTICALFSFKKNPKTYDFGLSTICGYSLLELQQRGAQWCTEQGRAKKQRDCN